MGSISGDSTVDLDGQDSNAHEEKIFVAVRLRPLNERELSKNDVSEWECINSTTILFKNTLQERTMLPTAYTFDRVFRSDASTKQVYEEAAKKIALSVLSGMNSTIFAYGQTSSGKTYTMSGITEYTIADIYDYINMHREREFVLKFSAMEIYNESVRDLLVLDGAPLRLLDDPERGTVVDKLTEVTLTDSNHLHELLSVCEAQRQIGETTLNELSSRSHQILRLTVESETREYVGAENTSTLTASVNFVDLAGSERASQTLSAGTRLKEGCHINRSLLTLGTVIRKLSKGRNAHIPYRDSKLTRILQNSLGGNARTAIICTMSPAHGHLEQSRNTLLFASCAKQVSTNAQVNVVMSEKALVKQLQKELARLENELRSLSSLANSCGSSSALKEKELLIEKMDKEIRELTHQRDLAQSRVEDMLRSGGEYQASKSWVEMNNHEKASWASEYSASEASEIIDPLRSDVASRTSHFSERYEGAISSRIEDQFPENNEEQFLSDDTSPRLYIDKYFGPDPCQGWEKIAQENNKNFEDNCKEVQCIEIDFTKQNVISSAPSPQKGDNVSGQSPCSLDNDAYFTKRETISSAPSPQKGDNVSGQSPCSLDNDAYFTKRETISSAPSPQKRDNVSGQSPCSLDNDAYFTKRETISSAPSPQKRDNVSEQSPCSLDNDSSEPSVNVARSQSCAAILTTLMKSPSSEEAEESENTSQDEADNQEKVSNVEKVASIGNLCREDSQNSDSSDCLNDEDQIIMTFGDSDRFDMGDEKTPKKPEETADVDSDKTQDTKQSASDWQAEFERQKRKIIELWDACHIPLVHRTYFFLLFKGDPSDAVYMEVELRRLSFLKNSIHGVRVVKDDQYYTQASSAKALNREREMLSKRMLKKYSVKEREALYEKWGIDVKSKQRRLQLCRRLWTDTTNMEHMNESASIVAKLVGFKEPGQAPKEMFGLSILPANSRSFSWRRMVTGCLTN
ncbi:hypothetical protein DH2020_007545 [Rehmannia glutinosa]|uniref:Kinesin-like protein n=1 Tax=Rehmannia glutinosa TaxID=99300 RepID=A0ABR0TYZ0_REHGL